MSKIVSAREQADIFEEAARIVAERGRESASRATLNTKAVMNGAPHVRRGEDPLSSRPFYIAKAANVLRRGSNENRESAKFEFAESDRLKKAMKDVYGSQGADYDDRSLLIPLDWNLMHPDIANSSDFQPMQQGMHEAVQRIAADPESILHRKSVEVLGRRKANELATLYKTPMSYINQQTGGAMVAPPQFGDLIPLLRNKAVMPNIGATNVPLPAQGSVKYPRQTGASTVYERPENTAGTESNPTFDDITLEPKEFIGLVRASNQLLTFAPGVAEAAIRDDMTQQIALTFDLACLTGSGGPNFVAGIVPQAVAAGSTVQAKSTGPNGNSWTPPDIARMIRKNMERNSDVKVWIMRPAMWLGITETRADSIAAGDQAGNYLWNMFRTFGEDFGEMLRQRKVVVSNQVANNQTKGSATDLTYILGVDGSEILVGMHGAMVLDANPWGDEAYSKNQTLLRSIMYGDCKIRRAAGIAYMPQLIVPNLDN